MSDGPTLRTNPYRATAVADTGLIGHDPDAAEANVATAEQARALALLDGYLRAQPGQWTGLTMMVSGEYGSGKTHLLVRLLDKALAAVGEPVRALYVVAGRGGFLQLFHSVLDAVTKDELVRQLDQYYADEVAAELAATDVPHVRLSAGFEVDSEIYRRVHDRLTEVTDNRDFTTALWLLAKDKRMAEPVWRWLKGEEPAVSLTNRGIVHRIGTDIAAMEALGVLALVLGGRNRKFVLAIDELSGIFARSATPRNQLLEPFQTMLEIAKKSGSCFVLCGLPDLMESFDDGVKGRIDAHVRLPNFTRGEVVDLVLRSHERTLGRRVLAPLSEDGATAVHDYTRGNPRQVTRLLHAAFARAVRDLPDVPADLAPLPDGARGWVDTLPRIDVGTVYAAAQELVPPTFDTVVEEIRAIAARNHWALWSELSVPLRPASWAEFRVETGHRRGDHAVLVARSLLSQDEVDDLTAWLDEVVPTERPITVVCVAPPSDTALTAIVERLGARPLVRRPTFEADLVSALSPDPGSRTPTHGTLAQISYTLTDLLAQVSTLSRATPDAAPLARAIAEHLRPQLSTPAEPDTGDALPNPVAGLFRLVEQRLGRVLEFDPQVTAAYARGGYDATARFRRRLFGEDARLAIGTAVVVQAFVRGFRNRIAAWFAEEAGTPEAEQSLRLICETYQSLEDTVPLFQLNGLDKAVDGPHPAIGADTAAHQLTETLSGFAVAVRDAALSAVAGRT